MVLSHGLFGEVVRTLEPETEADPFGILLSTLVAFGNALGRGPHFPVEGDHHRANLFAVLVGESSRGRKGPSLGQTLALFEDADADWKANCLTKGLSSGEGLIWAVRDPVEAMEPLKEKGKVAGYQAVVKDRGVADKRLLVVEPEFAQTLKVLRREGNTLSPIIRQAWDSGALTALSDTDCFNGFANRFLWALVRRSKLLPDGGRGLDLGPLKDRLASALSVAKSIGAMSRTPEARALWHRLYPELTAERAGLYGAVVGRGEAQTLRLSMLYALLDGVSEIDEAHLRAAAAVWRYCEASARIIFEGEAEAADPLERLLSQAIRAEPGINRRGLHRAIGGHMPAREMMQALGRLRDRGQVRCEMVATGGRPSECWFPSNPPSPTPVVVVTPSSLPEATAATLGTAPVAPGTAPAVPPAGGATPVPSGLTLAELLDVVSAVGGRLRRHGDGCIVEAPPGSVTPAIEAALVEHRGALLALLPAPVANSGPEPPEGDRVMSDAEFFSELAAL